jgi:probable blue pigment (indigoidine) exporter
VMSAVWMKRSVKQNEWLGIVLGILGVFLAAYPLLQTSYATPGGLFILALSMVAYSFGSVYYSSVTWSLSRISVNAWQVFIGGILLIPFTVFMHHKENNFDVRFWLSLGWLVIPVSIVAVQLWLRLLKSDAVQASLWLYLCPVFGFIFATLLLDEPFTLYTFSGTVLVLVALYVGQRKSKTDQ